MRQLIGIVFLGLTAAVVQAHALLLVPVDTDASKIQVIFSDDFAPDLNIKDATWKRFEGLKLSARDASGKTTTVKHTKDKGHLLAHVPVGSRVVFGEVGPTLAVKGDAVPKLAKYYVKAIIGAVPADGGRLAETVDLEIVPKSEAGNLQFQVIARGKPVSGATVAVMTPGNEAETDATTNDQGWTKSFAGAGRYGAICRRTDTTTGVHDGTKYEGVTVTATVVVNLK